MKPTSACGGKHPGGRPPVPRHCPKCGKLCASVVEARVCCAKYKSYRRLKCATCPLWINLGDIPEADFQRMKKIGVKCGDCVTASVIEYEEEGGDYGMGRGGPSV